MIYKIFGGKHVWPGAPTIFQANKIDDFDATQKIWEFFEDQSVPEELVAPRPNGLHISAGTLKWRPVEGVEKYLIYLQYKDGKVKFAESDAAEYVQDTTGLEMWAVGPRNQSKHVTWSKLMKSSD